MISRALNFLSILFVPTRRGRLYLTTATSLLVTLIAFITLSSWEGSVVRIISGLLLSWFMPGLALVMLLRPIKAVISTFTIVLSVVMSFILDILLGTVLEILNLGLNEMGFVIGLWLITILLLTASNFIVAPSEASIYRIRKSQFKCEWESYSKFIRSNYVGVLILGVILLLTISWAFKVNLQAAEVEPKPFTALTIDQSGADVTNKTFKITIENLEGKSMVYRLEMSTESARFIVWENIKLGQGEQWTAELPSLRFVNQGELWLFREGKNEPYRKVHLVVPQVAK